MDREEKMKQVEILKSTLVEDYYYLKEFLEDICEKEYDYVIFLTRRCLILAEKMLSLGIVSPKSKILFLSDYAVSLLCDKWNNDSTVCIADDILIHGRYI